MVDVHRDHLALQRRIRVSMIARGTSPALIERKYNPGELRAPGGPHGGQWVSGPTSAAKIIGKIRSDDGLDLEISSGPNGSVGVRFPWPADEAPRPDSVHLSRSSAVKFRDDLDQLQAARKTHAGKVRASDKRFAAAEVGTPEYDAAQREWFGLTDGFEIGRGSVPAEGGGALHWVLFQQEDDTSFAAAIEPPDAGPSWNLYDEVSDGVGGSFPLAAVGKLRKQLETALG